MFSEISIVLVTASVGFVVAIDGFALGGSESVFCPVAVCSSDFCFVEMIDTRGDVENVGNSLLSELRRSGQFFFVAVTRAGAFRTDLGLGTLVVDVGGVDPLMGGEKGDMGNVDSLADFVEVGDLGFSDCMMLREVEVVPLVVVVVVVGAVGENGAVSSEGELRSVGADAEPAIFLLPCFPNCLKGLGGFVLAFQPDVLPLV